MWHHLSLSMSAAVAAMRYLRKTALVVRPAAYASSHNSTLVAVPKVMTEASAARKSQITAPSSIVTLSTVEQTNVFLTRASRYWARSSSVGYPRDGPNHTNVLSARLKQFLPHGPSAAVGRWDEVAHGVQPSFRGLEARGRNSRKPTKVPYQ